MPPLELRARMTVRPGQLPGFKEQAAELMRLTRELDTRTWRYDWFTSEDGTRCEVHEAYESEEGLFEHNEHIMTARATLFRDFADGHHMTAYGEVSQALVDLGNAHAGGLERYGFLVGLRPEHTLEHARGASGGRATSPLELHAQLRVRRGRLAAFTAGADEIVELARELDTQTSRFDWFISEDGTRCEVHEAYESADGFLQHTQHIMAARAKLFGDAVDGHQVSAYGDVPKRLVDMASVHGSGLERYPFLQGLQLQPSV